MFRPHVDMHILKTNVDDEICLAGIILYLCLLNWQWIYITDVTDITGNNKIANIRTKDNTLNELSF